MPVRIILRSQGVLICEGIVIWHLGIADHALVAVIFLGDDPHVVGTRDAAG